MTDRADDFNRADSTSSLGTPSDGGSSWVAAAGTWGINSNRGYLATSSGGQETAYLESSVADVDVQVTLAVSGSDYGVCARLTDASNNLIGIRSGASDYRIYKRVAGSFTQLGSTVAVTSANGDVMKFTANGSSLTLYQNGVSKVTATDSFNNTATKHGLRSNADTTTRFDDFSITGIGGGGTPVGLATETDAAQVLAGKQLRALGLATETDAAQALAGKQIRALGLATETDSALALAGQQLRAVGLSTETDTALALSSTAGAQVGMAVETDTALALSGVQVRAVGRSDETDTALALSGITGTAPGVASETDTAFALAAVQKLLVGAAQEVDTALRLNAGTGYTDLELIIKILSNRQELNAGTGTFTVYDDDSVSVLFTASAWADAAGTIPYSGGTLGRIDALA